MLRKTTVVAMGILLACASVLLSVPTALAASHSGDLRMKGPGGTAYTQGFAVSQVGAAGATLTYTIQVQNTGSSVGQFLIRVVDATAGTLNLYDGTVLVQPLASGPDGYYTRALPPGGNQVLTAKMTILKSPSLYHYESTVTLYGTDGVELDQVFVIAEQTAPTAGGPYNLAVKAGSQKPVGNGQNSQVATAGTIAPTGTATFTATLRNGGTGGANIYFRLVNHQFCTNYTTTVKQGTTNVTAAALAGTYNTGVLAPGQARTLKITLKATGPCRFNLWEGRSGFSPTNVVNTSTLLVNQSG